MGCHELKGAWDNIPVSVSHGVAPMTPVASGPSSQVTVRGPLIKPSMSGAGSQPQAVEAKCCVPGGLMDALFNNDVV